MEEVLLLKRQADIEVYLRDLPLERAVAWGLEMPSDRPLVSKSADSMPPAKAIVFLAGASLSFHG